jgi:hypothetical protein
MSEKSWNEQFIEAADGVRAALHDEEATVGASVDWRFPGLIAGNLGSDGPSLSSVYADDFGRLWKERHHGDSHSLVCILDLRRII